MAQLRQRYSDFIARGAEVVVIGPENAERFARHWHRQDYPFVGLPDPEHKVADLYRQEVNMLKLGRLPTLIVVDRDGRVRYQHHGGSMRDIPDSREILSLLDKLNLEGQDSGQEGGQEASQKAAQKVETE